MQDDVVMGTLTVRENLRFSAALRLPMSVSQKEKEKKVQQLIEELGLTKVADSRVGHALTSCVSQLKGKHKKRNDSWAKMASSWAGDTCLDANDEVFVLTQERFLK